MLVWNWRQREDKNAHHHHWKKICLEFSLDPALLESGVSRLGWPNDKKNWNFGHLEQKGIPFPDTNSNNQNSHPASLTKNKNWRFFENCFKHFDFLQICFMVVKSEYFKDPAHYLFKDPTCVCMFSPQCLNWTDYPHIVDSKDHGHMDIQNRLFYLQSSKLCRHHQMSATFTKICPTILLQHVGSYFRNKKQLFSLNMFSS